MRLADKIMGIVDGGGYEKLGKLESMYQPIPAGLSTRPYPESVQSFTVENPTFLKHLNNIWGSKESGAQGR